MLNQRLQRVSVLLVFSVLLATIGVVVVLSTLREQDLSRLICQASDVNERFILHHPRTQVTSPYLGEKVVDYYAISLDDLSVSYATLGCSIVVYESEAAAHRALERACSDPHPLFSDDPDVGKESCYPATCPYSLTFRRDEFLVQLCGDVRPLEPIANAVDKRIRWRRLRIP